jgi:Fe2+ or Zn2+ uptake regulation protein
MGRKSRNTRQKELIRGEIARKKALFTAEELYRNIREKDANIGVATIYRFLREAKEAGDIYAYECEGKTVFSLTKKDHCHFVCKKCGKIIHFNVQSFDFLKRKLDGNVNQFQLSVEGLCKNCAS